MRLVNSSTGGIDGGSGRLEHTLGRANYLIECYGIHAFLTDLDTGRDYWRESKNGSETIVQSCLTWLVEESFSDFFDQFDVAFPHGTRHQWQQRYMIALLKA